MIVKWQYDKNHNTTLKTASYKTKYGTVCAQKYTINSFLIHKDGTKCYKNT